MKMMRFEAVDLKPFAESISSDLLHAGRVYFAIGYVDRAMLIPEMQTLVYIGKDLDPGDNGKFYFQDVRSHREGARYGVNEGDDRAKYYSGGKKEITHIFEFSCALHELMKCELRRRTLEVVS